MTTKRETSQQCKARWSKSMTPHLVGKTVQSVRWMSAKEVKQFDWDVASVVIRFTDGTFLIASSDDEGNDAGVLFGYLPDGEQFVCPVIP